MGTYTANKNLYMPTVGEQGWGDLMNTNLSTIDNFLKPITVSGSTYTFTGNQTGGSISATSITNSGTLTNTGKITANGGIGTTTLTASSTSTFTGKITANGGIGTKALTTTSISNSGTLTQTGTSTFTGKITANGGVNDYEERITALEAGEFETITADNLILPNGLTLSYNGYFEYSLDYVYSNEASFTFLSSPFLLNGVVSAKTSAVYYDYTPRLYIIGSNGLTKHILTTTQTEYTVTNAHTIFISWNGMNNADYFPVITLGKPIIS